MWQRLLDLVGSLRGVWPTRWVVGWTPSIGMPSQPSRSGRKRGVPRGQAGIAVSSIHVHCSKGSTHLTPWDISWQLRRVAAAEYIVTLYCPSDITASAVNLSGERRTEDSGVPRLDLYLRPPKSA